MRYYLRLHTQMHSQSFHIHVQYHFQHMHYCLIHQSVCAREIFSTSILESAASSSIARETIGQHI